MLTHLRSFLPSFLRTFLRSDQGQDLIEYGLLGAFISVVSLVAIQAIGPLVEDLYEAIETALAP